MLSEQATIAKLWCQRVYSKSSADRRTWQIKSSGKKVPKESAKCGCDERALCLAISSPRRVASLWWWAEYEAARESESEWVEGDHKSICENQFYPTIVNWKSSIADIILRPSYWQRHHRNHDHLYWRDALSATLTLVWHNAENSWN